jgi:flagellar biogenesis protein FliO
MKYAFGLLSAVIVIGAAYYATWWIASRSGRVQAGRHIKVRERFALTKNTTLCLVEVKDKVYFIALSGNSSDVIADFKLSEFDNDDGSNGFTSTPPNFMAAMKTAWEKRKGGGN